MKQVFECPHCKLVLMRNHLVWKGHLKKHDGAQGPSWDEVKDNLPGGLEDEKATNQMS